MKQIRDGELIQRIIDRGDGYFHWLQKKSGLSGPLSSMLAETEFVSLYGLDDTLKDKAKEETRRKYAEEIAEQEDCDDKETDKIIKSIRGNCCLFEVVYCLADSVNEMFEGTNAYDGPSHFFGILMENAGFDRYDEEDWDMLEDQVREYWQKCIDRILKREYMFHGGGGLFPLRVFANARSEEFSVEEFEETYSDRRDISLWQQMNDWVDQHTNEDGEWVD